MITIIVFDWNIHQIKFKYVKQFTSNMVPTHYSRWWPHAILAISCIMPANQINHSFQVSFCDHIVQSITNNNRVHGPLQQNKWEGCSSWADICASCTIVYKGVEFDQDQSVDMFYKWINVYICATEFTKFNYSDNPPKINTNSAGPVVLYSPA